MIRVLIILITTGLVFSTFSGCGGGSSDQELRIAVIPKGETHIFWENAHAGAMKAEQELGVKILWDSPPKESDRQVQIQIVQKFIGDGVNAIALAPLDSRSLVPVVKSAGKRNIPVIIFDSNLDSEDYESFIATDNYAGGAKCAELLASVMNKKGKVIVMRYQEGSASTTNREQGFLERIVEIAPDIELISTDQYAGATYEESLQVSQNLLSRFPGVNGIYTPNETATKTMLQALQEAGKAGIVKFVGFDADEDLITAVKSGEIDGLAVQDPFNMGYLAVKTAVMAIKGEKYEPRINTDITIVTRENLNQPRVQELLYPEIEKWLK